MNTRNMSAKFLVVILLLGMLLSIFTGCSTKNDESGLPAGVKADIAAESKRLRIYSSDIPWCDKNATPDFSERFYRYLGTYGDCIVYFLSRPREPVLLLPGATAPSTSGEPVPYELKVHGRTITCPSYFELMIFNPDVVPPEGPPSTETSSIRVFGIEYSDEWLTNEQMDQALDDLEKWIAEIE